MNLRLIVPPEHLPVSMAELKADARLDPGDSTDDARLAGCLRAAVARLDGAEGLLGKALITQTWELLLPSFPYHRGHIDLPLPPLQEIISVAYTDPAGDVQTLATDRYQVVGTTHAFSGWIAHAYATTWPATRWQDEAVTVTFRCGYGDSWNDVPEALRQGIIAMAAAMLDGCGADESVTSMLSAYRTRFV